MTKEKTTYLVQCIELFGNGWTTIQEFDERADAQAYAEAYSSNPCLRYRVKTKPAKKSSKQ